MLRVLSSTVQSETKRTCKASFSSLIANFKAFDISTASSLGYCDPSRSSLNLHEFKCINIHEQSPNIQSVTNQHSSTTRFRYETMMTARRAFSSMAMTSKERVDTDDEREIVQYVTLNTLADNPGATKKKRRVGRGIGSSKGKTCGRGHKGQKSRSGGKRKINSGFEGGQTKLYKRIPKRGFSNKMHAQPMVPINLGDLQDYIDMKRLPTSNLIQMNDLVAAGLTKMNSVKFGIKLLAKGKERFRTPIQIQVSRASKEAIEAIEKVGGEITTVHYTPLSLRALMKPHKFKGEVLPKNPLPPPRLMTYYNNYENRGYLSPQVQKKQIMNRLNQGGITEEMDENNKDDA